MHLQVGYSTLLDGYIFFCLCFVIAVAVENFLHPLPLQPEQPKNCTEKLFGLLDCPETRLIVPYFSVWMVFNLVCASFVLACTKCFPESKATAKISSSYFT